MRTKRINKAYRTFLFKKRMIAIVHLLITNTDAHCYFCGKHFIPSDFPLQGKDKVEIYHTRYVPEVKVLAHRKCHKKFHAALKKANAHITIR